MTHRMDNDLDRILSGVALAEGVDANLLRAFSLAETNGSRWAVRYEEEFNYLVNPEKYAAVLGISKDTERVLQKTSWGPMQIMGAVAREAGYQDHLTKLTDAGFAYYWSVVHLKRLFLRWGDEQGVISAWNFGSPKRGLDGKYMNQAYVDKVTSILGALRS